MDTHHDSTQQLVREMLEAVDISLDEQPDHLQIRLTDLDQYSTDEALYISPGQLAYAAEQYQQITGERVDAAQLEEALSWD